MTFLTLGLTQAILGYIMGMGLGMLLTMGVRVAMGLAAWSAEPAWAVGAIFAAIGALWASGAVSDWAQWAKGKKTTLHHGPPMDKPSWTRYFSVDYSHKIIGIQYGVTGIILLGLAGVFAMVFRTELLNPGQDIIGPQVFNSLVSAHGIVMIAGILLGIGGMSNYLVPLMIGASDMAFPRLNAFAYWVNIPGVLMVVNALFVGGWNTGWTGYPPLGASTGPLGAPTGILLFYLGVFFVGLSSILGAVNFFVTVFTMRAPGMSLFKMPIFIWAMMATSLIALTATQLIGLSFLMVVVQRLIGMGFFNPNLTAHAIEVASPPGNVVLFQHLFWFYSHPAVYVFILPGLGIISELLPVFARKPLFGYKWIALSSMTIAIVGFLVWGHHMFVAGMEEGLRVAMMWTTLLVAVPTGVKFFSWLGTLWGGKLEFPTPMLFVLGAISVFLIGGLTGPPNGTTVTDTFLHDTYWVVGHFHATMFGGFVFPFIAAVYYWFPKVTGRMYNETLGKVHFWLMTPGFWLQSIAQMMIGLKGMRRRIWDYDPALGIQTGHILVTVAGVVIFISMILFVANLLRSAKHGAEAGPNPWRSRSPEFQIPSPVPEHSYAQPMVVVGEPYDYGKDTPYIQFQSSAAD